MRVERSGCPLCGRTGHSLETCLISLGLPEEDFSVDLPELLTVGLEGNLADWFPPDLSVFDELDEEISTENRDPSSAHTTDQNSIPLFPVELTPGDNPNCNLTTPVEDSVVDREASQPIHIPSILPAHQTEFRDTPETSPNSSRDLEAAFTFCWICSQAGHQALDCKNPPYTSETLVTRKRRDHSPEEDTKKLRLEPLCQQCGSVGHRASDCPCNSPPAR